MPFLESEIRKIVTFMRENGVTHYHSGDLELTVHPSALEVGLADGLDVEASGRAPGHANDYEDPMLYPDGVDPVAEQREWLKSQTDKTLIGLNQ
jgi:hypothetical protein